MMRFTIFTYSNEGALDRFPLEDKTREQLVGQATMVCDFLLGRTVDERDMEWLMRALVAVPGVGIWPLMELRAYTSDPKTRRRFTSYVHDLVRSTMARIMFDEKFGHQTLSDLDAHIKELQKPLRIEGVQEERHQHPLDPNITDLAESVLALMEAVYKIDRAYNCVLPNNLLGNLEQCQEKLKAMVVRR